MHPLDQSCNDSASAVKKPFIAPVMEKVDVALTENAIPNVNPGDGPGNYHS